MNNFDVDEGKSDRLLTPDTKILQITDIQNDQQTINCYYIIWRFIKRNLFLIFLVVAIFIGFVLGVSLRLVEMTPLQKYYVGFPGEILMNMLTMLALPLMMSTVISSMASLNVNTSGRIGIRTFVYYVSTTFLSSTLGMVLALSINPGSRGRDTLPAKGGEVVSPLIAFIDLVRSLFPRNLIEACMTRISSMNSEGFASSNSSEVGKQTEANITVIREDQPPVLVKVDGMNALGLVVFAMLFGRTISVMGAKGEPLKYFFESLSETVIRLLWTLYWYCPIGIVFIIAGKIVQLEDPLTNLVQMGFFVITVLSGLIIHGFVFLPAVYLAIVRKNPFRFMYNQIEAIVTVFALSSSISALPITMRCLLENNKIDRRIVNFTVPLGTTINMDGTALFEAVACIFIAQLRNIPLNVGQVITVSVTATLAAIGTASFPSGGVITLLMVVASLGLPADDIGMIFTIDWFLSRCRGTTNIIGDAFGAGIVEHLSKNELRMADTDTDINNIVDINVVSEVTNENISIRV